MCKNYHTHVLLISLFYIPLMGPMSCDNATPKLKAVTVQDFREFVEETGYVTDAEKYGWSFLQTDIFNFKIVEGLHWNDPDGSGLTTEQLPVTQVSYNDALAYCEWAGVRLPTYEEYWELVRRDERPIVSDHSAPISPTSKVNIVGNVWDITATLSNEEVRLAGGSLFCSQDTCHGTKPDRKFYVDLETANIHIGFSVVHENR